MAVALWVQEDPEIPSLATTGLLLKSINEALRTTTCPQRKRAAIVMNAALCICLSLQCEERTICQSFSAIWPLVRPFSRNVTNWFASRVIPSNCAIVESLELMST